MKPTTVALLCLACCFGAAGTSYLLFEFLNEPAPNSPAPAMEQSVAVEPNGEPIRDARVDVLEQEIEVLREQIKDLRNRAPDRSTTTGSSSQAGGGESAPVDEETLAKIEARLEEIEANGDTGKAMRQGALIDLKEGNGRDRREAAELLGMLAKGGDAAAKQALLDALKSEDPNVREDALEGIGESGLTEFIPALEAMIKDDNADVREEVAEALRDMPMEDAAPVLKKMLKDQNEDVLMEAIDAFGDAGYEAAREDIRPLTLHSNERIAVEAAIALRRTGDPTVAESWVPTLGSRVGSTDRDERRHAVRQLRRMRVEAARPYLEQALESEDGRVRRDAERALEELDER